MVNAGIIASLILSTRFGFPMADPVIAIGVAVYILYSAWTIGRTALDSLMDHELSPEDRERITAVASAHTEVKGIHDLRTRMAGIKPFIQLHLELPGDMTLHDAHIVSDQVEADLLSEFPNAEVIIHQDPEDIEEKTDKFKD
jgi:ferrous-iron efflux pump FieF